MQTHCILHEAITTAINHNHRSKQRQNPAFVTGTCLVMMRYFWKSLGPSWSSRVKRVTLTSGYLDFISSEQKRSRTPATPFPLSWGATRRPSTSMVSPSSITHTDSRAIWQANKLQMITLTWLCTIAVAGAAQHDWQNPTPLSCFSNLGNRDILMGKLSCQVWVAGRLSNTPAEPYNLQKVDDVALLLSSGSDLQCTLGQFAT